MEISIILRGILLLALVPPLTSCKEERGADTWPNQNVAVSPNEVARSPAEAPAPTDDEDDEELEDEEESEEQDSLDEEVDVDDETDDEMSDEEEGEDEDADRRVRLAKKSKGDAKSGDKNSAKLKAQKSAEDEAALARIDTEKAVNRALDEVRGSLEQCFNRGGPSKVDRDIKMTFRVHHTGRILQSASEDLDITISNCIDSVMDGVKVEDVKTDTISVERTFQIRAH